MFRPGRRHFFALDLDLAHHLLVLSLEVHGESFWSFSKLDERDSGLVFLKGSKHFKRLNEVDLSLLLLFNFSGVDIIFDKDKAYCFYPLAMEILQSGRNPYVLGSDGEVERALSVFGVVLFDLFDGPDEELTIFAIFLVAKFELHYKSVNAR